LDSIYLTFTTANIGPEPLALIRNKIPDIELLGLKEGVRSNRLTIEQTKGLISVIRAHVSFSVCIRIIPSISNLMDAAH